MNRLSIYAMIFGTLGIFFFILSGIPVGWNRGAAVPGGPPPLTALQVSLFYIFFVVQVCFVLSLALSKELQVLKIKQEADS